MKLMQIARTRALLAVGVIAVGLTVAACGSSSSSTSSAASGSAVASTGGGSTSATASRSAFRTCLQKHGVTLPNRRPPGSGGPPAGGPPGGGFFGGGGGGGGAASRFNSPKFRAAVQACGGFRGGFRGGGARRFRLSHTAINNFVACVRKNGYSQMPNPNFSGGPIFPTSIRTNKQFQAASTKCANQLRPARPSGTSTNPGA